MESLDIPAAGFMDGLLDFSDIGEEDDDERHHHDNNNNTTQKPPRNATALLPSPLTCNGHAQARSSAPLKVLDPDNHTPCVPEFVEEELEWLSNKDAFPSVETFVDILAEHTGGSLAKHHSPVSVLDNSTTSSNSSGGGGGAAGGVIMSYRGSFRVPGKARSKCLRRRPRDIKPQQCWWSQANLKSMKQVVRVATGSAMGRKCMHCGVEKTPQWRAGPRGPKTLCNACGVRFKSGRLVPEYRPANSPTFSTKLHSNFHRKVLDMRKQKMTMGLPITKPLEKG